MYWRMPRVSNMLLAVMIVVCLIVGSFGVSAIPRVHAAANEKIHYQGKLFNASSSPVIDGTYSIEFKLYTVSSGGAPIWTETQSVTTSGGLFSTLLGSVSALTGFSWNQALYLGLTVEADSEMTPRHTVGAVPAAHTIVGQLAVAQGGTGTSSVATAGAVFFAGASGDHGSNANYLYVNGATGNIGIGTSTPSRKLTIEGSGDTRILLRDSTQAATNAWNLSVSHGSGTAGNFAIGQEGVAIRMAIDTSGNVGIGTSTPGALLTLGTTNPEIRFAPTGSADGVLRFYNSNSSERGTLRFASDNSFRLETSGSERMRIDSSGRLFVGTSSVTTSSTQSGEFYASGSVGMMFTNTTAANYPISIKNEGTTGTRGLINFYEGAAGGTARANLSFDTNNALAVGVGGATRLTVDSSGNVGIGTTTPGHALHVLSSSAGVAAFDKSGTKGSYLELKSSFATKAYLGWDLTTSGAAGGDNVFLQNDVSGGAIQLVTRTSGGTRNFSALVLDSDGRVGIGTSTPSSPLTVRGANNVALFESSGASSLLAFNVTGGDQWRIGAGDVNVNDFGIRNMTDGLTRLSIDGAGNVGIGSTSPANLLTLQGVGSATLAISDPSNGGTRLRFLNASTVTNWQVGTQQNVSNAFEITPSTSVGGATFTNPALTILSGGNVGIGVASPDIYSLGGRILAVSTSTGYSSLTLSSGSGLGSAIDLGNQTVRHASIQSSDGSNLAFYTNSSNSGAVVSQALLIDSSGNIEMGGGSTDSGAKLRVGNGVTQANVKVPNGYLCVDNNNTCTGATTAGTVYAVNAYTTGADVAENYPTNDTTLVPGEIVAVEGHEPAYVVRATDVKTAFGIISTAPGVLLAGFDKATSSAETKVAVALAGRVPVKFSLENGPVVAGDRITLSSIPGVAMKASATSTLTLGIALEDYTEDTEGDTVLTFVSLQDNFGATAAEVVQQLGLSIESLASTTAPTTDDEGNTTFLGRFFDRMVAWFADTANGIGDFFAKSFRATEEICVGATCITEAQLANLLANANGSAGEGGGAGEVATTTPANQIVITGVEGDLTLTLGTATTSDLLVGVTAMTMGTSTTIASLEADVDNLIDWTSAGTFMITYRAIDNNGAFVTAERKVIIEEVDLGGSVEPSDGGGEPDPGSNPAPAEDGNATSTDPQ